MPITVLVRTEDRIHAQLTFDGMQPIVIGRGTSCDVRIPHASVSFRHASIRAQGAVVVVVDEGSTNGTLVAGVRVAAHTSRIVRSGDHLRVGRFELELRIDQTPVTRDVANATREAALALVAEALAIAGVDRTTKVRVLEGRDQGKALALEDEGRAYVIGRGSECDLPLADKDASREHAAVVRHGTTVAVRDLGAKNATRLGGAAVAGDREVVWRPAQVLQIGRTVLAIEEPVGEALAYLESAPDEPIAADEAVEIPAAPPSSQATPQTVDHEPTTAAPVVAPPTQPTAPMARRSGWSATDMTVMAAALGVLALSIAGLVYLLRP